MPAFAGMTGFLLVWVLSKWHSTLTPDPWNFFDARPFNPSGQSRSWMRRDGVCVALSATTATCAHSRRWPDRAAWPRHGSRPRISSLRYGRRAAHQKESDSFQIGRDLGILFARKIILKFSEAHSNKVAFTTSKFIIDHLQCAGKNRPTHYAFIRR